jgi:hypothetical protein
LSSSLFHHHCLLSRSSRAMFVLLFRSTAMTSGIHDASPRRNPEWEPVTPNAHLYQQVYPIATA